MTKPELNILFGAGASVGSGLPSTSDLTECLLGAFDAAGPHRSAVPADFFKQLKRQLEEVGKFSDINFEYLLFALEQLEPLAYESGPEPFPVHDSFRPILKAFVSLTPRTIELLRSGALTVWRGAAFRSIVSLIKQRTDNSTVKERELSQLLRSFDESFSLRLFTLNYDDLVDRVSLPWRDGFVGNKSNYSKKFCAKEFMDACGSPQPLLVHMHGSVLFGYEEAIPLEICKYMKTETAMAHFEDGGFHRNVFGRIVLSGPIISGLSKVEQLMFRPSPYGYYFHSFIDKLLTNPRLLILGYGGWDPHINEWILQFMQVHSADARIAYVGGLNSANKVLIDRICTLCPEGISKGFPYYGKNIVLEPAHFPFSDPTMIERLKKFLC